MFSNQRGRGADKLSSVRASAAALVLPVLAGCHYFVEPGYVNSGRLQGLGGGSLTVRGGTGDFRSGDTPAAVDVAVRGEGATSGSSVAVGLDGTIAPLADWQHAGSPYARAGVWALPARWGPAREASWFEPSVDLGWLWLSSNATESRGLMELGARVAYDAHPDGVAPSVIWGVYAGFGNSASMTIPR